ncbi:MAG: macrolide transporter [Chloroflexi bacterium RBG_16_63_12]|nr:MAG: macrolide transporter [Chloroflexi bacterium RBG_16_63_12]
MPTQPRRPAGMLAFSLVWAGQIVSVLATNMTGFAITIWVYERTHSATALGLAQVFFITPYLLVTPLVGIMVDRYNRKMMMMLSDLGAGLATVGLLVLQSQGRLEIWHLYAANLMTGTFNSFQWPAYSAAISTMVPKEQLGRANGMMSLVEIGPGVIAPLLAGALLPFIHLTGILLIDVTTFVTAIAVLLAVYVPQPPVTEAGREGRGGILKEALYGFRYIFARPSLLGLQLVFMTGNLMAGLAYTVLAPMILARTSNNGVIFGTVQSVGAIGGVIGGIAMGAWGGFRRRVHGVLIGWALSSLLGQVVIGLGRGPWLWIPGAFIAYFFVPLIDGSNQAIWQSKVAPDVQGRVFAARRLIAWLTTPISPLIAGPLADFVLEPGMREGGGLTGAFGWLVGTGPGAGMALLIIVTGLLAMTVGVSGYLFSAVRNAEDILPDHDAGPATAAPAAAN